MRRNTADRAMIEDFAELKKRRITDFFITTYVRGELLKRKSAIVRHTASGVSAFANRMYARYGDDATVEVGYFDENLNYLIYCTYHA